MHKMTVMALPEDVVDWMARRGAPQARSRAWTARCAEVWETCRRHCFVHLLAFLLGRLALLGDLSPFGLGFFAAATQVTRGQAFGTALFAAFGVLSSGRWKEAGLYVFAALVCRYVQRGQTRLDRRMFAVPLSMFFAVLFGGLCINYFNGAALYDNVVVLFNAVLCLLSSYLFTYGMPMLLDRSAAAAAYERPAGEALVCLVVILALAIAGVGEFTAFGFSLQHILSGMLVIALAYAGGAGLGAAVGVVVGLVVGLSADSAMNAITLYAVCGLLAGVFKPLGKCAAALGYIFGSMIIHLSFTQLPLLMNSITEGVLAAVCLVAFPLRSLMCIEGSLLPSERTQPRSDYLLADGSYKLRGISEMFYELAGRMGIHREAESEQSRQNELAQFLSRIGNELCESCANRKICWEEHYYRTYQNLLEILNRVDKKPLKGKDLPLEFREDCVQAGKLVEVVNSVLEKNAAQAYWQEKFAVQKQLIGDQMKAVGNIVSNLARELDKSPESDGQLAQSLRQKARQIGCPIDNVKIYGGKIPRQIEFDKFPCGKTGECASSLMPIVSGALRERLTLVRKCAERESGEKCRVCMKAAPCYKIRTAVAAVAKEPKEVSGDSVKVTPLGGGKVSILLSDGMGTGSGAAEESKMTVQCLSKLLYSDFDVDTAVKTVNALLMLRDPGEKFATVDMAIVDKYTGEAEFLKIASAPSFVKRVREVRTVQSAALPVGILNQIEIAPIKMTLAANDFLIMVSDGVADLKDVKLRDGDKDGWLLSFLRRYAETDEQKFAEAILQEAIRVAGGAPPDDMTVLVATLTDAGIL